MIDYRMTNIMNTALRHDLKTDAGFIALKSVVRTMLDEQDDQSLLLKEAGDELASMLKVLSMLTDITPSQAAIIRGSVAKWHKVVKGEYYE